MIINLTNGRQIEAKELIMRGKRFGRQMRRNIWRRHFPGYTWEKYLELEARLVN